MAPLCYRRNQRCTFGTGTHRTVVTPRDHHLGNEVFRSILNRTRKYHNLLWLNRDLTLNRVAWLKFPLRRFPAKPATGRVKPEQ